MPGAVSVALMPCRYLPNSGVFGSTPPRYCASSEAGNSPSKIGRCVAPPSSWIGRRTPSGPRAATLPVEQCHRHRGLHQQRRQPRPRVEGDDVVERARRRVDAQLRQRLIARRDGQLLRPAIARLDVLVRRVDAAAGGRVVRVVVEELPPGATDQLARRRARAAGEARHRHERLGVAQQQRRRGERALLLADARRRHAGQHRRERRRAQLAAHHVGGHAHVRQMIVVAADAHLDVGLARLQRRRAAGSHVARRT